MKNMIQQLSKIFLKLYFDINNEDINNIYTKRTIYILHYPNSEKFQFHME